MPKTPNPQYSPLLLATIGKNIEEIKDLTLEKKYEEDSLIYSFIYATTLELTEAMELMLQNIPEMRPTLCNHLKVAARIKHSTTINKLIEKYDDIQIIGNDEFDY